MQKNILHLMTAVSLMGTFNAIAQAETLSQFFAKSHIDGQIRSYYFSRLYGTPNTVNAYAYSLAGRINIVTAPFLTGFRVGVSFYTANALGTQPGNPARIDKTLMGTSPSVNALGQAYLEYRDKWGTAKVGNQLVDTPWLNRVGGRMIPATYQGVTLKAYPFSSLKLSALRYGFSAGKTAPALPAMNYSSLPFEPAAPRPPTTPHHSHKLGPKQ